MYQYFFLSLILFPVIPYYLHSYCLSYLLESSIVIFLYFHKILMMVRYVTLSHTQFLVSPLLAPHPLYHYILVLCVLSSRSHLLSLPFYFHIILEMATSFSLVCIITFYSLLPSIYAYPSHSSIICFYLLYLILSHCFSSSISLCFYGYLFPLFIIFFPSSVFALSSHYHFIPVIIITTFYKNTILLVSS